MNKTVKDLENELNYLGYVFNPKVVYDGSSILFLGDIDNILDYDIKKDVFYLNSKNSGKNNLYEEFVNKYFYDFILGDKSFSIDYFKSIIVTELASDKKSRIINFNYMLSLYNIIRLFGLDEYSDKPIPDNEMDLIDYTIEVLKIKRNRLLNVSRLGVNSEYYNEVTDLFKDAKTMFSLENVKKEAEHYTDLLLVIKNLKNKKDFNIEGFKNCFDLHTLYMVMAKILIEETKKMEDSEGKVNSSFIEVTQYVNVVNKLGLSNYNPSMIYYDYKDKKLKKYTFEDLKKDVYSIMTRHPEYRVIEVTQEEAEKNNILNDMDAANAFVEKMINREELLANWEFVRKGKIDREKDDSDFVERTSKYVHTTKCKKDYYEQLVQKRILFESTNYVYRIVGINKFEGYIGYIYPNGIVAFERMYEDKEQTIPAKGNNAVYIMTIENFIELSKLTKIEIINYIKNTNNPNVWRLYHNDKIKERLMSFINGVYYSTEVESAIDKMLDEKVLSKKLN